MLLHSIPSYRLPRDIVIRLILAIENMGIKFETGINVGKDISIERLTSRFDIVFIATGAWKERPAGIPGEEYALSGMEFLNRVKNGDRKSPGRKVTVIGGGNVAMDVARTLLRLGVEPIIVYRRSQAELPAFKDEIKKAMEEGIRFEFLTTPAAISKVDDGIVLTCRHMHLGAPDESGRLKPIPIDGSDFTISCDAVIKAIGETPDMSILPDGFHRKIPETALPVHPGGNLFAGGDFITGPSTVIQAVASGRKAVDIIQASLGLESVPCRENMNLAHPSFRALPRARVSGPPVSERIQDLDIEDVSGLTPSDIENEARRCLNCSCLAVSPSDMATALVALDAGIVTTKRTVPARLFFKANATTSTVLDNDELIIEVHIPKPPAGTVQRFEKFTLRKPIDFAVVSVASVINIDKGVCRDARIVLGAVAPVPVRAKATEEFLKGRSIDEKTAAYAGKLALKDAVPLTENAYKIEIAKVLVKRSLLN